MARRSSLIADERNVEALIFVKAPGASSFTYAQAAGTQGLADRFESHSRRFCGDRGYVASHRAEQHEDGYD
jgi:hypothetical protein